MAVSGFGTARLLFCHQNEEPKIFFEVLSATTAFSLIFVSEYMLDFLCNPYLYKNEVPPWFAVQMGSVAESVAAKLHYFP